MSDCVTATGENDLEKLRVRELELEWQIADQKRGFEINYQNIASLAEQLSDCKKSHRGTDHRKTRSERELNIMLSKLKRTDKSWSGFEVEGYAHRTIISDATGATEVLIIAHSKAAVKRALTALGKHVKHLALVKISTKRI